MGRYVLLSVLALFSLACAGERIEDPSLQPPAADAGEEQPASDAGLPDDAGLTGDAGVEERPAITRITVEPDPELICLGGCLNFRVHQSRRFIARAFDADDVPVKDASFTWSSSDETLMTVTPDGGDAAVLEALKGGEVVVRAAVGDAFAEVTVNIERPYISSVVVDPRRSDVNEGQTVQLTARAYDEFGGEVAVDFSWTSANAHVATVDASGLVTATGEGFAVIYVEPNGGGASGWAGIKVTGTSPLPAGFKLRQLSGGSHHTCGIAPDNKAWCWGWNYYGQLGVGRQNAATEFFPTAEPVSGSLAFSSIHLGGQSHSCAIAVSGDAYCWGLNESGQMGFHPAPDPQVSSTMGATTPQKVLGGLQFTQLAVGGNHTCGIATDGKTYCWGANFDGTLGVGDLIKRPTPNEVSGFTFKSVAAGLSSTCALEATTGQAYCWGRNGWGQLGLGLPQDDNKLFTTPQLIPKSPTFVSLSLQSSHACAIDTNSEAWCWGNNTSGQLGTGDTVGQTSPVKVNTTLRFTQLVTGAHHTCGLATDKKTWCWGSSFSGQLGHESVDDSALPVEVAGGFTFVSLSGVGSATCGVTAADEAYCWGSAYTGETGAGFGGGATKLAAPWPVKTP